MSWQAYVDDQLVAKGNTVSGAILGHDGSIWAKSANFNLTESVAAAGLFTDSSMSVTLAGTKYQVLRKNLDEEVPFILTKKKEGGAVLAKTAQTVIIGVFEGEQQPGNASNDVLNLADYLAGAGY
ncbi:profilin-1 [Thecamonas trahens ATCC 50062]|uniref:Profilin n=1 Tax=Thecamonas trahens ATCC 50062 TaxID=461836 RepID=A0A0L0D6Y1_THETB|nr:profilin-1 [Thecamonas trahens ATCC 50062]KNC48122.1 profilin-1 [Thecamonas trahens ATCC 50062]|eukprot:XP_013758693.1 profilin-1 [Thecamonas trahens ATCC 50062]